MLRSLQLATTVVNVYILSLICCCGLSQHVAVVIICHLHCKYALYLLSSHVEVAVAVVAATAAVVVCFVAWLTSCVAVAIAASHCRQCGLLLNIVMLSLVFFLFSSLSAIAAPSLPRLL